LSALIGVRAGSVYRGHYFLQLLPPVTLLAAWVLANASRRIRIVAAPAALVYWFLSNGLQWGATQQTLSDQRYDTLFFYNSHLVGKWLRTQPDRSVYVFASEPEIYYYADATPVTRYVIQNPLFGGFSSSSDRQLEVWSALTRNKPRWIVTVAPPEVIPFFPGSDPWLVERVNELLAADYQPRVVAVRDHIQLADANRVPNLFSRQLTIWERATR
jgi:hypothetical protein